MTMVIGCLFSASNIPYIFRTRSSSIIFKNYTEMKKRYTTGVATLKAGDNVHTILLNLQNMSLMCRELALSKPFCHRVSRSFLQFYMYVLLIVVCPVVLFLLVIVVSVLLRYTDSNYLFGIFKLFIYLPANPRRQGSYTWGTHLASIYPPVYH